MKFTAAFTCTCITCCRRSDLYAGFGWVQQDVGSGGRGPGEKSNASTGQNNLESGTITQGKALVTIAASGLMTVTDSQSNTIASGQLAAIADTSYLYDHTAKTLSDPCNGMFTFRTTAANSQQDIFVSFQGNSVIFSSFQAPLQVQPYPPYTYFYGVGGGLTNRSSDVSSPAVSSKAVSSKVREVQKVLLFPQQVSVS